MKAFSASESLWPVTYNALKNTKNTLFWDMAPCTYFVNRRFGGIYGLHLQGRSNPRTMNQREQIALDWVTVRYTQLYKNRKGRETSGEERGRVCGVSGQQEAGQGRYWRERQGYRESKDPVASCLTYQPCLDLRNLVDLTSCSGGFLREQMRGFHDLLRQNPTSLFMLLGWNSSQWPP
jgi:hypothetical protein